MHTMGAWLIYGITTRVTGKRLTALLAALIFIGAPIHTEGVVWLAAAAGGVTSGLLCLLATWLWIIEDRGPSRVTVAVVACLYFLALLVKEVALPLPALLFLLDWAMGRIPIRDKDALVGKLISYLPLGLALGLYAFLYWRAGAWDNADCVRFELQWFDGPTSPDLELVCTRVVSTLERFCGRGDWLEHLDLGYQFLDFAHWSALCAVGCSLGACCFGSRSPGISRAAFVFSRGGIQYARGNIDRRHRSICVQEADFTREPTFGRRRTCPVLGVVVGGGHHRCARRHRELGRGRKIDLDNTPTGEELAAPSSPTRLNSTLGTCPKT